MATQFDIQKNLRTTLQTDAALSTWLQSTFGQSLTVLLGNRPFKKIRPEAYPVAVIVFVPEDMETGSADQNCWLDERYHIELGLHENDVEKALEYLGEFERLAGLAIKADITRAGLAEQTVIIKRTGDADVNHPHHFFGLTLRITRTGPY